MQPSPKMRSPSLTRWTGKASVGAATCRQGMWAGGQMGAERSAGRCASEQCRGCLTGFSTPNKQPLRSQPKPMPTQGPGSCLCCYPGQHFRGEEWGVDGLALYCMRLIAQFMRQPAVPLGELRTGRPGGCLCTGRRRPPCQRCPQTSSAPKGALERQRKTSSPACPAGRPTQMSPANPTSTRGMAHFAMFHGTLNGQRHSIHLGSWPKTEARLEAAERAMRGLGEAALPASSPLSSPPLSPHLSTWHLPHPCPPCPARIGMCAT